jgi:hypothetical protein
LRNMVFLFSSTWVLLLFLHTLASLLLSEKLVVDYLRTLIMFLLIALSSHLFELIGLLNLTQTLIGSLPHPRSPLSTTHSSWNGSMAFSKTQMLGRQVDPSIIWASSLFSSPVHYTPSSWFRGQVIKLNSMNLTESRSLDKSCIADSDHQFKLLLRQSDRKICFKNCKSWGQYSSKARVAKCLSNVVEAL